MNEKTNSQFITHNSPVIKKGYKKTEIGIIPEDWEVKSIIEFSKPVRGGSPRPAGSPLYFNGNFIPWLTVASLTNIPVSQLKVNKTETYLTKEGSSYSRVLEKNTLIIANSGATLGIAKLLGIKCCANDGIAALLEIDKKVVKKYLVHFINTKTKALRERIATGNGQPNLNTELIGKIKIPLPPLPEQKAIAEVLADTDELIQTLEKQIAKKRLIKQGTMQKLLTPKDDWEVKELGEIAYFSNGKAHEQFIQKDAEYIVINSKFVSTKGKVFKNATVNLSPVNKGEIVMVMSDIPKGKALAKCFLVPQDNKYALNQRICSLKTESVDKMFLFLILNRNKYYLAFDSGTGQTNLKKDDVLGCPISLPLAKSEQTQIATILSDMVSEIEMLENKLAKYKKIKQGMMQELLTGKIRLVNVAQIVKENRMKVIPIKQKKEQKLRKNHNWQINEAVVISVLTEKFGSEDYPLGRKRYTKFSYLLHRHIEHKAEGYLKKAAGPYNPSTKYKGPETIAQKNKYIQKKKKGEFSGFVVAENIEKAQKYFEKWYGDEALEWLEQFRFKTNDTLELWTTVDMAIQDLREKEKVVTVEMVKSLINNHKEWKPKLKRPVFSDENIEIAIKKLQSLLKEH